LRRRGRQNGRNPSIGKEQKPPKDRFPHEKIGEISQKQQRKKKGRDRTSSKKKSISMGQGKGKKGPIRNLTVTKTPGQEANKSQ